MIKNVLTTSVSLFTVCLLLASSAAYATEAHVDNQTVVDLLDQEEPLNVEIRGFGAIETYQNKKIRWIYGPAAELLFFSTVDKFVTLELDFASPFAMQTVSVEVNGKMTYEFNLTKPKIPPDTATIKTCFQLRKGENVVRFLFKNWNEGAKAFAPKDTRPMAAMATRLSLFGPSLPPPEGVRKPVDLLSGFFNVKKPKTVDVIRQPETGKVFVRGVLLGEGAVNGRMFSYGDTQLFVLAAEGEELRFDLSLSSEIEGQVATFLFNRSIVESVPLSSHFTGVSFSLTATSGINELLIRYSKGEATSLMSYGNLGRASSQFSSLSVTFDPVHPRDGA